MSIAEAERLKHELTDKYVVVAENVPELRRFVGLTGKVRTVNMNCRALVEFDAAADIGWYDIAIDYLTVVDAPLKKEKPAAKPKAAAKAAPAKKAAGGMSPLEAARAAAAGKGAKKADKPKSNAGMSPLEAARAAGGGSTKDDKPKSTAGMSPLEAARAAGSGKTTDEEPPAEEAPACRLLA